jgi:HSP20 family protein
MSLITVTDPSFDRMERRLNQVFDHFFTDLGLNRRNEQENQNRLTPAVDVYEDEKNWVVHAELPGVKKEDIKLENRGNTLVISGESTRKIEHKQENIRYQERRFGSFSRTVPLPENVDKNKINAKFEDGVLEVRMPKSSDATPKKITIS